MIETRLRPTLVSLITRVCAIAPTQQSAATEVLRGTFIDRGRELDYSCLLPAIPGMVPCSVPPAPVCMALDYTTPPNKTHLKLPSLLVIHKPPWLEALGMLVEMLATGLLVSTALHSLVCVANLLHRLEVWDSSAEAHTHNNSYELPFERLRLFHEQVGASILAGAGSIYDSVLSGLPGGLGSKFTRDALQELGMACGAVSWWSIASDGVYRTWRFIPRPLPNKPAGYLLFV
jgi:hypothetical protein